MKRFKLPFFLLIVLILMSYDPVENYYYNTAYQPILMDIEVLRNSIAFQSPQDLTNPGKIYTYGDYLFISERYRGIHVYNNSDPENPINMGFIRVPGCLDMSISNNYLYVDNSIDLVTIDLNNMGDIKEASRVKNVFPEPTPPDDIWGGSAIPNKPENSVIVEWIKK